MAGSMKVLLLKSSEITKATYFHCAAHALNLCIVAACSVQVIRNMHGTMQPFT